MAAKFWINEVTVKGRGEFPIDMLRYDGAYPAAESESANLLDSRVDVDRTVRILAVSHAAQEPFTDKRWESFGWQVLRDTFMRRAL